MGKQGNEYALCILVLMLGLLGCRGQAEKTAGDSSTVPLHPLKKLFVRGDFYGDGREDTIFQHNYSRLTRTEIYSSPDPFENEWDTVVKWFLDRNAEVYLTLHKNDQDTLRLGPAQGLYCLINMGDVNTDGKDEIALVVDYVDFSSVNSCRIYSLCNNKWTLLKEFEVHEGAFNVAADEVPAFNDIKGYLEKQNGRWEYRYSQDGAYNAQEDGVMLPLSLDGCK